MEDDARFQQQFRAATAEAQGQRVRWNRVAGLARRKLRRRAAVVVTLAVALTLAIAIPVIWGKVWIDPSFDPPVIRLDRDKDGVQDSEDNCPGVPNADQGNSNSAGRGDACDPDDDNDGVPDAEDNCHAVANPGQEDADSDGLGDACDPDGDNDGVPDAEDNCHAVPNSGQKDADGDGLGDACDDSGTPRGSADDDGPLDAASRGQRRARSPASS